MGTSSNSDAEESALWKFGYGKSKGKRSLDMLGSPMGEGAPKTKKQCPDKEAFLFPNPDPMQTLGDIDDASLYPIGITIKSSLSPKILDHERDAFYNLFPFGKFGRIAYAWDYLHAFINKYTVMKCFINDSRRLFYEDLFVPPKDSTFVVSQNTCFSMGKRKRDYFPLLTELRPSKLLCLRENVVHCPITSSLRTKLVARNDNLVVDGLVTCSPRGKRKRDDFPLLTVARPFKILYFRGNDFHWSLSLTIKESRLSGLDFDCRQCIAEDSNYDSGLFVLLNSLAALAARVRPRQQP